MKRRILSLFLILALLLSVLPTSAFAASDYCNFCGGTYVYTLGYEETSSTEHYVRHWCSNCGYDQTGGILFERHSMSGGRCIQCGYSDGSGGGGGGSYTCYHGSTYLDWSGCTWYKYCNYCGEYLGSGVSHGSTYRDYSGCYWYDRCSDCGEALRSGTSHGSYSYRDWEYYSTSQHRRLYACDYCGEGSYQYSSHSTTAEYYQYSDTQHEKSNYCSTCYTYVSSSYESHSFTYGSYYQYDQTQHYRTITCSKCGHSEDVFSNHSLRYGSWTSYDDSEHMRTMRCSTCGLDDYQYAGHSFTYGRWTSYNGTQHRRTIRCSTCGYSGYEYLDHDLTTNSCTSISDTQHQKNVSCSCGYSGTITEAHSLQDSTPTRESDTTHKVTKTCSCGYSKTVSEPHNLSYGPWSSRDADQHERTEACVCGYSSINLADHNDVDGDCYCDDCSELLTRFSVTLPASLSLTVSETGQVFTAENVVITNNSTRAVRVTDVSLTTENGWTLVPFTTNMADAKVNSKQIGFVMNGVSSQRMGQSESLDLDGGWNIPTGESLPLSYNAVVSATSTPIREQVLTILFVADWSS